MCETTTRMDIFLLKGSNTVQINNQKKLKQQINRMLDFDDYMTPEALILLVKDRHETHTPRDSSGLF